MGGVMRRAMLTACLLSLAACGRPATPLSDAIDAFRAGDRAALRNAKMEADEALASALQPDGDLCAATIEDIRKYSEAARVRKFDDAALFALPEPERLVYAVNVAGPLPKVAEDSPLRRAPLVRALADHDPHALGACRKRHWPGARTFAVLAAKNGLENARAAALRNWTEDLRSRVGKRRFDAAMRQAAARLARHNVPARWPVTTETFAAAQRPLIREAGTN